MVDYKITIKKIHSAIPELTTDELITIMDCITDVGVFKDNVVINDWNNYKLGSAIISSKLEDNSIKYSTSTKNSI